MNDEEFEAVGIDPSAVEQAGRYGQEGFVVPMDKTERYIRTRIARREAAGEIAVYGSECEDHVHLYAEDDDDYVGTYCAEHGDWLHGNPAYEGKSLFTYDAVVDDVLDVLDNDAYTIEEQP